MSRKRRKMSKSQSKRDFKRKSGSHRLNGLPESGGPSMRGGIRL